MTVDDAGKNVDQMIERVDVFSLNFRDQSCPAAATIRADNRSSAGWTQSGVNVQGC